MLCQNSFQYESLLSTACGAVAGSGDVTPARHLITAAGSPRVTRLVTPRHVVRRRSRGRVTRRGRVAGMFLRKIYLEMLRRDSNINRVFTIHTPTRHINTMIAEGNVWNTFYTPVQIKVKYLHRNTIGGRISSPALWWTPGNMPTLNKKFTTP